MEVVIRVTVIYLFLLGAMRVMGKREFSQMAPMEFVTLLLIPEIVTGALIGEDHSITSALVGIATLFVLVFGVSTITHLSPRAAVALEGRPTVLAHRGRFLVHNLNRERVTTEEVYGELRKRGLERIDQVRWAILEGDGKIAVVPEAEPPGVQDPDRSKLRV
jgi:uncharacterized membrane protein YcaP (DUF421 family)